MEVQQHGNIYEDLKIQEITGIGKKEYDLLKKNGYTSTHDITKGIMSDEDVSIKTTKGNTINCGDILRRVDSDEYRMIVGQYRQDGENKVFHTEWTFWFTEEDKDKLWGRMEKESIQEYVNFVTSIPHGKESQQETKDQRQFLKEVTEDKKALFSINPKVDSKKQRRVQCSLHIDRLVASGVKYTKKDVNITINSSKRVFN